MSLEFFKKSLEKSLIQKKGDYYYIVHPFTDGIPEIDPKIFHLLVKG